MGTRPFYAGTFRVRPEVWVRLISTFLSSNSHLNALRIHQLEQEGRRLRSLFFTRRSYTMLRVFVGVDVSQDHLDVHVRPSSVRKRFANTAAGIAELLAWVRP